MEWDGNEKRIRALFSELSLEDQSGAPQFGRLWSRAQVVKGKEVGRPVAVLVSLLVTAAACSLAAWSWYRFTASPTIVKTLPQEKIVEAPYKPNPVKVVPVSHPPRVDPRRQNNVARRRQTDRSIATDAALLSSWQSPTQSFMESPSAVVLSSLPQLNQSVKDLESFLSKNSEIMKESNR
jgi:hypothetical protein